MPEVDSLVRQHSHRVPDRPVQLTLESCRDEFLRISQWVRDHCPPGRETALVQTKLDEARMWACNALTLNCPIDRPAGS